MTRFVIVTCLLGVLLTLGPAPAARLPTTQAVGVAELSESAERAIQRGLEYLARSQNADGSWGKTYPAAETAVSLMAFMVKGHFPKRGKYGTVLDKAVNYILKRSEAAGTGYLGGQEHGMYEHGLATLALSEVWGESDRQEVGKALKKAVEVILKSQNEQGGWRYAPQPKDADISVTVMQIVALASAKEAGIAVPDSIIDKAIKYVLKCQNKTDGGFAYQPGGESGMARAAAGVLSLMMCGQRETSAVKQGLDYLRKYPENKFKDVHFYYYAHYYAIQCMYQAGDDYYQPWYPNVRNSLLSKQTSDGSWPEGERASPAFNTGVAILVLGVPYRFLPIYQR
jgi:squalene cyclase